MKLQPLITLWLLIPYLLAALGGSGWQFWRLRRKDRKVLLRWSRRTALLLLPAVIALGPSILGGTSAPGVSNLDIIFAVDTTPSMAALDYTGSQQRLDGVKKDMLALVGKFQGARMEIITFDSNANVILPFTDDPTAFTSAVQGMDPEYSSYSQGSAIDKPISLITQELKNSKAAFPEHDRLVFYMGDGEQTINQSVASFAPVAPYLSGGAVLGYGTTTGAKIANYTGLLQTSKTPAYIMTVGNNNTLTPAISHIDPTALKLIASQMKVAYLDRDQGGSIGAVYSGSKAQLAVNTSQHISRYLNLYWLLAVPYVILLFWEWQSVVIKMLDLRVRKRTKHV